MSRRVKFSDFGIRGSRLHSLRLSTNFGEELAVKMTLLGFRVLYSLESEMLNQHGSSGAGIKRAQGTSRFLTSSADKS